MRERMLPTLQGGSQRVLSKEIYEPIDHTTRHASA